MECNIIDVEFKAGDEFNLSIYGDTHEDSPHCDHKQLREHMDRRAALPNARFIGLGDMADLILPRDMKRYMPSSGSRRALAKGYDAMIDQQVTEYIDDYKKYPWDLMAIGNHEHEILKRHYTNLGERISVGLGCKYGGYSGFLRYTFKPSYRTRKKATVNILYHHGAWGGRVMKGFGGARDYARGFDGFDIFAYGHNHQTTVHQECRLKMNHLGTLMDRDVYFVNTGTWLRTALQGSTSYGERRGYMPVSLGSPLIKITPKTNGPVEISVSVGDA